MNINFKTLTLKNFKSHSDLSVHFGEVTEITGDNAEGKSSIGEALTWLLYSVDMSGSTKFNPKPITYDAKETEVTLLLQVDDKELLLGKVLKKTASYYVNEVPAKANEYKEVVEKLFDKELFLSLFNPLYFPSLKWEKQREMIMQYVSTPANKEVLKGMSEPQAEALAPLLKKNSLAEVEKIYRDKKNKLDKQYIAAESRTKTLKEHLNNTAPTVPVESLKVELSQLHKERGAIRRTLDEASAKNKEYTELERKADNLLANIDSLRAMYKETKQAESKETCETCGQPLDESKRELINKSKADKLAGIKGKAEAIAGEHFIIIKQLNQMEKVDTAAEYAKLDELQDKITPIERELDKYKELESLEADIEAAQSAETQTLKDLNNAIFIIDSVKAFKQKEAELQAEKVQALFTTLTIKLTEIQKNGEPKNTFEIELNGKPFSKLSLSESIRAGLELRDVLSQQSGVVAPVFLDNAESITKFKEPVGQLIVSRVVAGRSLKVEGGKSK